MLEKIDYLWKKIKLQVISLEFNQIQTEALKTLLSERFVVLSFACIPNALEIIDFVVFPVATTCTKECAETKAYFVSCYSIFTAYIIILAAHAGIERTTSEMCMH